MNTEQKKLVLSIIEMAYKDPKVADLYFSFLSEEELSDLPELKIIKTIVNNSDQYSSLDEYRQDMLKEVNSFDIKNLQTSLSYSLN
ncbi:hypothetical protein AB6D66_20785 [Vibrio pomeroyi]|uniref:Uncharacterized protein n=1 Tax=Vibrio pomeroyi TaxID=198832 RepID=A0ABV4N2F9_9VIBR|nr:hypothetical protein [Vibrio campbellii]ELI0636875.1 hypothetical protein [Vibrio harveyi]UTZ36915.1 hypothetical protein HB763_09620 [Vibrio campbellii]